MNEAETRAEHIDPALQAAGWGVVEGSRVRREYRSRLGRHRRRTGGAASRSSPITCWSIATQARRDRGQGVGRGADRRRGAGQELRRQAGRSASPTPPTARASTDRHADRHGRRRRRATRRRTNSGTATFAEANAWRDRFAAVPFEDKGGYWQARYYQDIAIERVLEAIADGRRPHPADARHRHRQDLHRLPDRLEAVPEPLEPEPRADAPPAHPVPRRPQHPRRPGLQRLLRLPRRCAGADRAGGHPQEGQGAEERQPVLHHLPDLHERPAEGRQARRPTSATIRPTSSTSSSSTSAIAAARTTRATGAASSNTSRRPCSSA